MWVSQNLAFHADLKNANLLRLQNAAKKLWPKNCYKSLKFRGLYNFLRAAWYQNLFTFLKST
jgi:hypothetical protein